MKRFVMRVHPLIACALLLPLQAVAQAWPVKAVRIMAETRAAIENIDEIVAVPGVDAVFFGPNDLSFSPGYPGQMQLREVVRAIEHGVARALAAGVAPGVLAPSVADFHRLRKMGVRYLPMVISGLIGTALRSAVAGAREPA
jgi:4-hydroxy-2-oxoheptanedioate aldolase